MKLTPADLSRLKLSDLEQRRSKMDRSALGRPWQTGGSLADFVESLPHSLAADQLRLAAQAVVTAIEAGRPVILGLGAHVIKVGLAPVVIEALQRGHLTALAMNGAVVIHDVEMALAGHTSEEVAEALADGSFGTARQTGQLINQALADYGEQGFGRAVGRALNQQEPPNLDLSLLAAAARLDLPATVHMALGTDIIHSHPGFDPAASGAASHLDFRLLVSLVGQLQGGVYLNVGSAVVLPEVFLKALSAARNLGLAAREFTTVNMDMISHYRPLTNVVTRPVLEGGRGINLIGHHEINLPLLLAIVAQGLA